MLSLSVNKQFSKSHTIMRTNRVKKNFVVRASKSSQEIKELLRKELAKANDVCCDMTRSDLDCMLQWDVIDDLSHAYRNAVEDEKRKQDELNEKTDREHIWNTSKKTFDI